MIEADALAVLAQLPTASVDAIVADSPYGVGIVGEAWDGRDIRRAVRGEGLRVSGAQAFEHWTARWAAECRRILKPGGHLVAFGAPRTWHRLASGIEDADFEIRDTLMWLFAQGLPKSHKLPGGLATSLKPAYEPIVLARKPLEGTTAANLASWGTGALNVDATRLTAERYWPAHVTLTHASGCAEGVCARIVRPGSSIVPRRRCSRVGCSSAPRRHCGSGRPGASSCPRARCRFTPAAVARHGYVATFTPPSSRSR